MKGQYDYEQPVVHERVKGTYRHRYVGAVPMPTGVRTAIYTSTMARTGRRTLTQRQLRQLRRMENRKWRA